MTDYESPLNLEACFSGLPDPRVQGRCDHKLMDIVIIAVCTDNDFLLHLITQF